MGLKAIKLLVQPLVFSECLKEFIYFIILLGSLLYLVFGLMQII